MQYDIFIDESGLFIETSTDPAERIKHHGEKRKFASQLAGYVCPKGRLTDAIARNVIGRSLKKAGIEVEHGFHCNEFKNRNKSAFDLFVQSIVNELASSKLQPIRIVNEEGVSYGDRVANYTNILAELLVRVCRQLQMCSTDGVELNVYAAKVRTEEDDKGVFEILEKSEYMGRINEYFARAAVANGWSGASAKWKFRSFQLVSGKDDPRLWIADAISNASHDSFSTIGKQAGVELKDAIGHFDWTLSFDQTLQYVSDLAEREAFGLAIISLSERVMSEATSKDAIDGYRGKMREIVSQLFAMPPSSKIPQFQIITGWLQQIVEIRADLPRSLRICKWLESELCDNNDSQRELTLKAWLRLVFTTWALTACNHDGNTTAAREYANQLSSLMPTVAGRWEFVAELMQAIVSRAVHLNDCFEHDLALADLRKVATYYSDLGSWFGESYPELFTFPIHSDQCGKALGTQLQSEIFQLLAGKGSADAARTTSDRAIAEFLLDGDKRRQYQYRSEVEAIGGEWSSARKYLAMSLGIEDNSHASIAGHIKQIGNSIEQGFALLHWTRIGGMAAVDGIPQELAEFTLAIKREKFEFVDWVQGKWSSYPSHGILRRMAAVYAANRDLTGTLQTLSRLGAIVNEKPRPIFRMIQIAALMQSADLISKVHKKEALALLFGDSKKPGTMDLVKSLRRETEPSLPKLAGILSAWEERLASIKTSCNEEAGLAKLAKVVGY